MKLICTRCNRSRYAVRNTSSRCDCGGTFAAINESQDDVSDQLYGIDSGDPKELNFINEVSK